MKESSYLEGREELLPRMRDLPSLVRFEAGHLRRILGLSKIRQYDPGEVVIRQGDLDCWMYILIQGEAKVERDGKAVGRLRRTGDLFGEMGVISGEPRSATVRAVGRLTCLALDASIMNRLEGEDQLAFTALFYRLFSEILSARLRDTSEELSRAKAELEALKRQKASD